MAINHSIEWEVKTTGSQETGSAFNPFNPNAGPNYSYGTTYQTVVINDLELNQPVSPYKPDYASYTIMPSVGSFAGDTYWIGIRFVVIGGNGEVVASSEMVETADFIPNNARLIVTSPVGPGYPYEHYQVFLRPLASSIAYGQFQDYGGGQVATDLGVNLTLNTFSTSFQQLTNLPYKGTMKFLSSPTRDFISDDIGNFIYVQNNHIGFKSRAASLVSNTTITEMAKTSTEPLAAWIDVDTTKTFKQLSIVMWAQGSPVGDIYIELRDDNAGVPSGTVIDFGVVGAASLSSSPEWVSVNVNSTLAPGRYWIVFYLDGAPSLTNYIKIGRKLSAGFQDLNDHHLFIYDSGLTTWSNVDTGIAVAIDAAWNSTSAWGDGDYSSFIVNKGDHRFEILNVTSGQAAVIASDLYVAEDGATGGYGVIGGAINNLYALSEGAELYNIGGIAHVQSGTYVLTSPLELWDLSLSGYEVFHYDLGEKPILLVDDTADPVQFSMSGLGALSIREHDLQVLNIEIDGNDFAEKLVSTTDKSFLMSHCWLHNSLDSGIVLGSGNQQAIWIENSRISNITGTNATSSGFYADANNHVTISGCVFDNIVGVGIYGYQLSLRVDHTIIHDISGSLTSHGNGIIAQDCSDFRANFITANQCSKAGIKLYPQGRFIISNSLFTNGGDHGILADGDFPLSFTMVKVIRNAYYNNVGNTFESNPPYLYQTDEILLTSSPYVHLGNDYVDFTLNTTTGSGSALVGVAYPTNFLGTVSNQKLDIGAVQTYGNQPTPRRHPTITFF